MSYLTERAKRDHFYFEPQNSQLVKLNEVLMTEANNGNIYAAPNLTSMVNIQLGTDYSPAEVQALILALSSDEFVMTQ